MRKLPIPFTTLLLIICAAGGVALALLHVFTGNWPSAVAALLCSALSAFAAGFILRNP